MNTKQEYKSIVIRQNGVLKVRPEDEKAVLGEVDITTAVQPIQSRTLTIKKITGAFIPANFYYSRVNLEIPVEAKEEVIEENGEYEFLPGDAYEALSGVKITVDVPSAGKVEEKEFSVEENGEYEILPSEDVDAMSKVLLTVDVQPELEEQTIEATENGEYIVEASEGKDGLSKVTVNVNVEDPSGGIFIQSKEASITANGDTVLIPDVPAGYNKAYFDKVKIHTEVEPLLEEKLIQANGVYTPSAGFDGFGTIRVDINDAPILQEGNITLKENGRFTLNPEEGYDGLSKADIVVDVKAELEPLTVTSNGAYTPSKDGFSVVAVNVPSNPADLAAAKQEGITEQKNKLTGISITSNGTYNREDGYNTIVVDVQGGGGTIVNQNKTFVSNGVYTCDPGYTGLGTVTVNVPSVINNQNKTVTSNGTITADDGYSGLGVVTVNVKPSPSEIATYKAQGAAEQKAKLTNLSVTSNGTYNREDGYNSIVVNVPQSGTPTLQAKTVEITSNGKRVVSADAGYDGLATVTIDAKVGDAPRVDMSCIPTLANLTPEDAMWVEKADWSRVTTLPTNYGNYTLTELDLSGIDCSLVETCAGAPITSANSVYTSVKVPYEWPVLENGTKMFSNMIATTDLSISAPALINGSEMFSNCTGLESFPISLNLARLQNGYRMFYYCEHIVGNLSTLKLPRATNVSYMFNRCLSITGSTNLTLPKASNAKALLYNTGITSLDINLPVCTDASILASSCKSITTAKITLGTVAANTDQIFYHCDKLKSATIVGNLISQARMFDTNSSLESVDLGGCVFYGDSAIALFWNCESLTSVILPQSMPNLSTATGCFTGANNVPASTLVEFINKLPSWTAGTHVLGLGAANLAKLTDAQIAVATTKGWTLN